jgi:hypothetical protein
MTTQYFVRFFFYPFKTQGEKILGRKHIYLPHAQAAIYDSKVKLFLKQGISRQLGRDERKVRIEKSLMTCLGWKRKKNIPT